MDDDFDGVDSTAEGSKIDEQISAAFQQNCLRDVMEHISPEKLSRLGEEKWQNMSPEQLAEALRQMDESVGEQEAEKKLSAGTACAVSAACRNTGRRIYLSGAV